MEDDIVEEDFGQTVVLTKRIKGVLRGYPEGTAVLKELLQNADDAGCVHALMIIYDVFFFHLISPPRHHTSLHAPCLTLKIWRRLQQPCFAC